MPKTPVINGSPILGGLIQGNSDSSDSTNAESSLPVVPLPESGEILHCLLTFIFLVAPRIPSTHEETMELLSVAQKYQMGTVLIHLRGSIAQQYPPPTDLEPALRIYSLAQKYGLRPEALHTAHTILNYPMTIENFDNKLDIMPGASLYELWKYHEGVRAILGPDLTEFRTSGARGTVTGIRCGKYSSSHIPQWIDQYIESIGNAPNLLDLIEFNIAMARHINGAKRGCECASVSRQTILDFWAVLASIVHGSFEKAESALSLVQERECPPTRINTATSPSETFDVSDADLVIRSSDFVDFQVHKLVLSVASPFFKDLLSSFQPSDGETVDGLHVVQLSEDSELLNSLLSMLYPLRPVIPKSYDKGVVFARGLSEIRHGLSSVIYPYRGQPRLPAPEGTEAFAAYAIASGKGLIPEIENAARQTLDHPMTFEILGEGLRLFEGWALLDLASFRRRCRDNLVTCLDSFFETEHPGPSSIWLGCPEVNQSSWNMPPTLVLPTWLNQLLSQCQNDLKRQKFTDALDVHSRIRGVYSTALQTHTSCNSCMLVHIKNGSTFCAELENKLAQAREKESVTRVNQRRT